MLAAFHPCLIFLTLLEDIYKDEHMPFFLFILDNIPKNGPLAALDQVLIEASRLFKAVAESRPNAKNVLVVITDETSDSDGSDLKREAISLDSQDIKVIAVALGDDSDKDELDILTPEQGEVIEANSTDGAKKTAEKIMKEALEGVLTSVFIIMAIGINGLLVCQALVHCSDCLNVPSAHYHREPSGAGSEIALSWSPMRLNIWHWRPEFHNWSPAGD